MKKLILLLLFSFSLMAFSQQISPDVIASGGDHFESDELSLSWTIGETVVSTLESDVILTQGFHQGNFIITAIDEKELENLSINIFPNPTPDYLYIDWKSNTDLMEQVHIQLLDMNGKVLLEKSYHSPSDIMMINLQSYERAHYILRLINGKQMKSFKIIKT